MIKDVSTYINNIIRWELLVQFLYRDKYGYMTIGAGEMLPDIDAAFAYPFIYKGESATNTVNNSATKEAIEREWKRVSSIPKGKHYSEYKAKSTPYIGVDYDVAKSRIPLRLETEFFPGIYRLIPKFDSLPLSAREAVVDIAWNCGIGMRATVDHKGSGLAGFTHFLAALNDPSGPKFDLAKKECGREGSGEGHEARNTWTANKFETALKGEG